MDLRTEPAPQRRDGTPTIYLAHPESTFRAELHRLLDNQAAGRIVFPRVIHTASVDLHNALDLNVDDHLAQTGLDPADIAADDWSECQAVGETAAAHSFDAVVAPSTTGDGIVLAVYPDAINTNQPIVLDTTEVAP